MMSQFPSFFYDTVRVNFQLAKENASDDEILDICKMTGLLPILERAVVPIHLAASLPVARNYRVEKRGYLRSLDAFSEIHRSYFLMSQRPI